MATKKRLSPRKAMEILEDGKVQGYPLTGRQRRFMGAVASGQPIKGRKKK